MIPQADNRLFFAALAAFAVAFIVVPVAGTAIVLRLVTPAGRLVR